MDAKNESPTWQWPEAKEYKKSIRIEFSIYVSVIICILMIVTGFIITKRYVASVSEAVVEKLLAEARSYSGQAGKLIVSSETPDALLLSNICTKLTTENTDIYWAGIAGQDNTFLAHSDIKQVISAQQMTPIASSLFVDLLSQGEYIALRGDSIIVTVPIEEHGIAIGTLGLASSDRQIIAARNTSILTVVTITLAMMIIGIPLTMFILHRKLRPIEIITHSLQEVNPDDIDLNIPINKKNEFGYLASTLAVMGTRLNAAQQELVEKERIARELEIAREIQTNILPHEFPSSSLYEFSVNYQSAREVGGDYYDFIEFANDRVGFLVADVSGKSLPGMLVMLLTRDIIKRYALKTTSPAELLQMINQELIPNIKKGMFVTMFVGVIEANTGILRFASAGHNPLIHIPGTSRSPRLVKTKGFPLGMMKPEQFNPRMEEGKFTLSEDDWLIQYTDGINEAKDVNDNEYGMDRFVDAIVSLSSSSPRELVSGVIKQHATFVETAPQFDDITLLAMKWHGKNTVDQKRKGYEAAYAG